MRHRLSLRYERALLPEGDCAYAVAVACLVVVPRWLYAPQPLIALLFLLLPLFAVPMLRNLYLLSLAGGLLVALRCARCTTGDSAAASQRGFSDVFHRPVQPLPVL